MLWLQWTWKPWRNAAEPGSGKAPMDACENGAASIKSFLRAFQSFGKAYISSETSFISVSTLSTHPSPNSHSSLCFFLYFHPEVLVPSAGLPAPRKQPELAYFGKMQAHETAWKCECFSGGTEEATELKPRPDKIQGAFTVMKFFSKELLFVWSCCAVIIFQ